MDRAVERMLLTGVADVLDEVDAVLRNATVGAEAAPAFTALRMVPRQAPRGVPHGIGVQIIPVHVGRAASTISSSRPWASPRGAIRGRRGSRRA